MHKKIIISSSSKTCQFHEAQGLKILKTLLTIEFDKVMTEHEKPQRSLYRKGGLPRSGFDPKANPKDIDRDRFCAKIIKEFSHIDQAANYDEIIVAADPKVLGVIRKLMSKEQKRKVSKEINKDLTHLTIKEVEDSVFGE